MEEVKDLFVVILTRMTPHERSGKQKHGKGYTLNQKMTQVAGLFDSFVIVPASSHHFLSKLAIDTKIFDSGSSLRLLQIQSVTPQAIRTPIFSATSLKEWTSSPHSHASQPASRAPQISLRLSSPMCTASSVFTPKRSHAAKKIAGLGFSAPTSADTTMASNQWLQRSALKRGLRRVSKLETTAILTPASLNAWSAAPAPASARCHASAVV
eukprot:c27093_g1_i3 orf=1148-1780(-)